MKLMNLFLLFLQIVSSTKSHQKLGDACNVDDSTGICSLLNNCSIVYSQLLTGKQPKSLCGFLNEPFYDPIVCCPTKTITASSSVNVESRTIPSAKEKCVEYARAVYTLEKSPILSKNRQEMNVSVCAIQSKKLIIGGKKAEPKEFPHMAAVGYNGENGMIWGCGGSLISESFVLTAAHCISTKWGKAAFIRVGDLNLISIQDDSRPQDRKIIKRIKHPLFKPPSQYHDIGLLKIDKPVIFDAWVRPACLPTEYPEIEDQVIATGWGKIDWSDDNGSHDLLKVTLNLVPQEKCNSSFNSGSSLQLEQGIVRDWQICAGGLGEDTCQGDSGGPLSIFNKNQDCMYDVIGITSLGILCGKIPSVYTRVYHYVAWLEKIVWFEE